MSFRSRPAIRHRHRVVDGIGPQQSRRDRTFEGPSGVSDPARVLKRVFDLDVGRLRVSRLRFEGIHGAPKQLVNQLAELVRRDGQRLLPLLRDIETQSILPDELATGLAAAAATKSPTGSARSNA